MSRLPPSLALLLATCVLVAATAPCPPRNPPAAHSPQASPATHAHAAHSAPDAPTGTGHHAHHAAHAADPGAQLDAELHAAETPFLTRPCTCGCQKDRATKGSSSRLGFALARGVEPEAPPSAQVPSPAALPRPAAAPALGLDPIPI